MSLFILKISDDIAAKINNKPSNSIQINDVAVKKTDVDDNRAIDPSILNDCHNNNEKNCSQDYRLESDDEDLYEKTNQNYEIEDENNNSNQDFVNISRNPKDKENGNEELGSNDEREFGVGKIITALKMI
jgi:hypothetical protein